MDNMQQKNVMQTDVIQFSEDQMIIDTPDFMELEKLLCSVEKETDNDFFKNGLMKTTIYYFTKLYYKKANNMYQSIYSIGRYIRKNHYINENFSTELTSDTFHTLVPKNTWKVKSYLCLFINL